MQNLSFQIRKTIQLGCCLLFLWGISAANSEDSSVPGLRGVVIREGPQTPSPETSPQLEETSPPIPPDASLREKIAQLMFITLQNNFILDSQTLKFLKDYPPGGIVLPPVSRPHQFSTYIESIKTASSKNKPFIAIDIHNLYLYDRSALSSFPSVPSLLSLAASHDPNTGTLFADLISEVMYTIGVSIYFGPPLQLAPELPDAKGDILCFGNNAELATEITKAIITSLQQKGIYSIPTGFPGGSLHRSGKQPAVLLTPNPFLYEKDLKPFLAALECNVQFIHVGNTLVPTLDPQNIPASISKTIKKELLREKLGFEGLIIAGPIDDEVIAHNYDISKATLEALLTGADMIFWNSANERVMRTIDQIVVLLERGDLPMEIFEEKFQRVQKLQSTIAEQTTNPKIKPEKLEKDKKLRELSYLIERKAITLIQNRNNTLPLKKTKEPSVGICGVIGVSELQTALEQYLKKVPIQPIVTARHASEIYDFEIERVTKGIQNAQAIIFIVTPDIRPMGQRQLIEAIQNKGTRVVVVHIGYPTKLEHLQTADAILLTYCNRNSLAEAMLAVADTLMGEGAVTILKPIKALHFQVGIPQKLDACEVILVPPGRLPIDVSANFHSGWTVSYQPQMAIKKVEWDFGDGQHAKGIVTEKTYQQTGTYNITLRITDSKNNNITQTFPVVVD